MNFPSAHIAFTWIGQPALMLPVYGELFDGAKPVIAGESPYLSNKAAGIEFALYPDHRVRAVFLYAADVEDNAQYAGALPADLSFASSRVDVRAVLGDPVFSGEAGGVGLMAIDHSFDRYEDGTHYLRFEYAPGDTSIRMVTAGLCED